LGLLTSHPNPTRSRYLLPGLLLAAISAAALLVGCQAIVAPRPEIAQAVTTDAAVQVSVETGVLTSSSGCRIEYTIYRPGDADGPVEIVLAHGFLRSKARMAGLATDLAAAGFATAAIDLCNMRPWDGAHRQNADDMRRVAAQLGSTGVLYVGFSAGGLAALLAASADAGSLGVVTLDLVDLDGMGELAATTLSRPLVALVGEPSRCNAQNNGLPVFAAAPNAEVRLIEGATHCDFETPTDGLCRLACEPADRPAADSQRIRAQIVKTAVAAAGRLLRKAADAEQQSTPLLVSPVMSPL
ncbi:MAG: hypothetical protein WBP89_22010, partial [Sedimenticolaceae bacterium]